MQRGRETVRRLSPRQREIRERERLILDVAREMLIERGYYGLTMDRIAEQAECPKGTMYQRFGCKEDIVMALACQCLENRLAMMRRGVAFEGRARERLMAMGEAVGLYTRLHPGDSRILHIATGPIREKASPERLAAMIQVENDSVALLEGVLRDAIAEGDLDLHGEATVEEIVLGLWSLVDGSYVLIESGIPETILGIHDPFHRMWRAVNRFADGYGWRPLFSEWDYEETMARIRQAVFPDEGQELYGKGVWYGDRK